MTSNVPRINNIAAMLVRKMASISLRWIDMSLSENTG